MADITIDVEGDVTHIAVPAYTRTWPSFRARLSVQADRYEKAARLIGTKPSIADFALFLLVVAREEPTSQSEDG